MRTTCPAAARPQGAPGQSVAITAGSRGIANIHHIIEAASGTCSRWGLCRSSCQPWAATAAATAEGQRRLIEAYGITESYCGCPIRAAMETVVVCQTAEGFPVHFDRHAFEADHVLVCGRMKPHTNFAGDIESGLMKMMLIGLGKHAGRQDLPPRHAGLQLRPDRPQRGRPKCCTNAGSWPGWGSSKMAMTRRLASKPSPPRSSKRAKKNCSCWPRNWMPRLAI